jgi:hypothetical protein
VAGVIAGLILMVLQNLLRIQEEKEVSDNRPQQSGVDRGHDPQSENAVDSPEGRRLISEASESLLQLAADGVGIKLVKPQTKDPANKGAEHFINVKGTAFSTAEN